MVFLDRRTYRVTTLPTFSCSASRLLAAARGCIRCSTGVLLLNTLWASRSGSMKQAGSPPMSPHTRSISQGLDGSLEESQVHLWPSHCCWELSFTYPHKGAQLVLVRPPSCLFLPKHPAWVCSPLPPASTTWQEQFWPSEIKDTSPTSLPPHPGNAWTGPTCPSYTASDYLSENNSLRGQFWKHVLREVTVCRWALLTQNLLRLPWAPCLNQTPATLLPWSF